MSNALYGFVVSPKFPLPSKPNLAATHGGHTPPKSRSPHMVEAKPSWSESILKFLKVVYFSCLLLLGDGSSFGHAKKDGKYLDTYIVIQTMRCYLNCDDIDHGVQTPDDYLKSRKLLAPELIT